MNFESRLHRPSAAGNRRTARSRAQAGRSAPSLQTHAADLIKTPLALTIGGVVLTNAGQYLLQLQHEERMDVKVRLTMVEQGLEDMKEAMQEFRKDMKEGFSRMEVRMDGMVAQAARMQGQLAAFSLAK